MPWETVIIIEDAGNKSKTIKHVNGKEKKKETKVLYKEIEEIVVARHVDGKKREIEREKRKKDRWIQ